jgi:hypothetical protein
MLVSLKLVLTIGSGVERRRFRIHSHAYAEPFEDSDPGWMIPSNASGDEAPRASAAVRTRAGGRVRGPVGVPMIPLVVPGVPLPPDFASWTVSTRAAPFFGIDPARLLPGKKRRRHRRELARARREARVLTRALRGSHHRWTILARAYLVHGVRP